MGADWAEEVDELPASSTRCTEYTFVTTMVLIRACLILLEPRRHILWAILYDERVPSH